LGGCGRLTTGREELRGGAAVHGFTWATAVRHQCGFRNERADYIGKWSVYTDRRAPSPSMGQAHILLWFFRFLRFFAFPVSAGFLRFLFSVFLFLFAFSVFIISRFIFCLKIIFENFQFKNVQV
jgi:hypothetical protein